MEIKTITHPENQRETVRGIRLKDGDIICKGDVYASSNGKFEDASNCAGIKLDGTIVTWVRPESKMNTKTT